jgi:uncharacterized delta-60 repeat protein
VGTASISEGFDEEELCVARYLTNGLPDNSFDDNGALVRDFNSVAGWTNGEDVSVQSDGKIVVVGRSIFDFFVHRFNVNGSDDGPNLEPAFGESDGAVAVKQDIQNRIFVVGNVDAGSGTGFTRHVGMQRITLDGDTSGDFHEHFSLPAQAVTSVQDIVLQSDGKFVIAGHTTVTNGGSNDFFIARFNANATLDSTFGGNLTGFRITDFGGDDVAAGMVISPSGGGFIVSGRSSGSMAAVKYTDAGVIDTTFGSGGGRAFVSGFSGVANIARGPGRRVVLAGGTGFPTARLLLSGANLITITPFDSIATEGKVDSALFSVSRDETLPTETKVFFSLGGTANGRVLSLAGTRDYTLDNLIQPIPTFGQPAGAPFVVIKPFEKATFVFLHTLNDSRFEGTETAIFAMLPDALYEVGTPAGVTISIKDDDVLSFSVGTTTATSPTKQVSAGAELQSAVTWTVPTGGWRQLSSIQLRLRDLDDPDAFVLLTFDEATNSFSLDASAAASYGPVSLLLDKCTFAAAGPTAPTVTVTFTFAFTAAAAKRWFALEVGATNDDDIFSGFSQVKKLHVHKPPKSSALALLQGQLDDQWLE